MKSTRRQPSSPLVLRPAYGRSYKTAEAVIKDWQVGKDFQIVNGPYCSIRDKPRLAKKYSCIWVNLITTIVRVE